MKGKGYHGQIGSEHGVLATVGVSYEHAPDLIGGLLPAHGPSE